MVIVPSARRLKGRESRIRAQLEVRLEGTQAAAVQTQSRNISLGGLCVRSQQTYPVGHPLHLEIALGGEWLELRGVVAWVQPDQDAVGVRFANVPEEAARRLEAM